jgi:hypothetical protein
MHSAQKGVGLVVKRLPKPGPRLERVVEPVVAGDLNPLSNMGSPSIDSSTTLHGDSFFLFNKTATCASVTFSASPGQPPQRVGAHRLGVRPGPEDNPAVARGLEERRVGADQGEGVETLSAEEDGGRRELWHCLRVVTPLFIRNRGGRGFEKKRKAPSCRMRISFADPLYRLLRTV